MIEDPNDDDRILEPFGLSQAEERLYRALLTLDRATVEKAASFTKQPASEVSRELASLESRGLVVRSTENSDVFAASPPGIALDVLLARRRQELESAWKVGKELLGSDRVLSDADALAQAITVVQGASAFGEQCTQLQTTASSEVRVFDKPFRKTRPEDLNSLQLERMSQGIRYRAVYESSSWDETHLRMVDEYVNAGEEARVVEELPVKMMITDQALAIISLRNEANDAVLGAAIVRSPGVVAALSLLFEAVWATALSFAPDDTSASLDLTDVERDIIALMVGGATDESIARRLDLHPATVRRRIKSLMKRLGATSRFQAGLQAAKKGWL